MLLRVSMPRVWFRMVRNERPTWASVLGSPPRSIAITTSAPIARTTSTGTLLVTPPSTSRRPSISTAENRLGIAMLARSARARSPPSRTTISPVEMSVATARNGTGSSSKSRTVRTGRVKPRSR